MDARLLVPLVVAALLPGCYGPGIMGWGSNNTMFEVMRHDGYIEVTAVGQGAMKGVPSGASPEYTGEKTRWEEFGLQFEGPGHRIQFERPANRTSTLMTAGTPFMLSNVVVGEVQLGQRLYFCTENPTSDEARFGAIIHDSFGGYNLWFEGIPTCV